MEVLLTDGSVDGPAQAHPFFASRVHSLDHPKPVHAKHWLPGWLLLGKIILRISCSSWISRVLNTKFSSQPRRSCCHAAGSSSLSSISLTPSGVLRSSAWHRRPSINCCTAMPVCISIPTITMACCGTAGLICRPPWNSPSCAATDSPLHPSGAPSFPTRWIATTQLAPLWCCRRAGTDQVQSVDPATPHCLRSPGAGPEWRGPYCNQAGGSSGQGAVAPPPIDVKRDESGPGADPQRLDVN
jgi:hypothetical protein